MSNELVTELRPTCICTDWKEHYPKVEHALVLIEELIKAFGDKDGLDIDMFLFCPWCGKDLELENI